MRIKAKLNLPQKLNNYSLSCCTVSVIRTLMLPLLLATYGAMEYVDDTIHVVWSDGALVSEQDVELARYYVEQDRQIDITGAGAYGYNYTSNPIYYVYYNDLILQEGLVLGNQRETPIVHREFAFDLLMPYEILACINGWQSSYDKSVCQGPPEREFTKVEEAVAAAYANLQRLPSGQYAFIQTQQHLLEYFGYPLSDNSTDYSTPAGFGNTIGKNIYEYTRNDGWNAEGTMTRSVNPMPYEDYTGYAPVNKPEVLTYPLRWQPLMESDGRGFFYFQQHVTPQIPFAIPYVLTQEDLMERKVEWPYASNRESQVLAEEDIIAIRGYAEELFEMSANLTEIQKLLTYHFDSKVRSLGFLIFLSLPLIYTGEQLQQNDSLVVLGEAGYIMATVDATIVVWKEKLRHDAVRPQSIIKYLLDSEKVTAWGGENKDGATQILAKEFVSYLRTMPHSEYPSGSACICEAVVEYVREYTEVDELQQPFPVVFVQGKENVPPGFDLSVDTVVLFRSLSEISRVCGESRLWGGFHFRPAIKAGSDLCKGIGKKVLDRIKKSTQFN